MRIGTPRQVAELLGVHVNTVYRLAQTGELPTLRRIGPRLRFDLDAVEQWMRDEDDVVNAARTDRIDRIIGGGQS